MTLHNKPLATSRKYIFRSQEDIFLSKIESIIHNNICNEQFTVTVLADEFCLSVSQLNRRLNTLINCSAGKLIRDTRMNYAAQMLLANAASVAEIAYEIGYANQGNFCRSFRKLFGCSPSEYARQSSAQYAQKG